MSFFLPRVIIFSASGAISFARKTVVSMLALVEQIRDLLTEHRLALIGGLAEFPCSGHIGFPPS